MGTRPLRQYYDGVSILVDDQLAIVDPWMRHRRRLTAALAGLTGEQWTATTRCTSWDAPGEAPFGHVPARFLLAHAYWDSWLHERDVLQPLGLADVVERDDLLAATWYTLVVGALQGGLVGDTDPVGPGPEAPIDVTLGFADLPDDPLHLTIDHGVSVMRSDTGDCVPAGRALDLVESLAGRIGADELDSLPSDLAGQLGRAALIL